MKLPFSAGILGPTELFKNVFDRKNFEIFLQKTFFLEAEKLKFNNSFEKLYGK